MTPLAAWWRAERGDLGVAALSGGVLVLAFPGVDLGGLAFVALVPWLARLPDLAPRGAALGGLAAGLAFYLGTLWWIAGTMVRYGDVPGALAIPVAATILLLLALYLSLFTAGFAAALAWLRPTTGPGFVLAAATLWVAIEYLRAHLLSGFPWNLLGYSQYRNSVLLPVVTVTGVYGLSFLVVAVNAALAWLCRHWGRRQDAGATAALAAGLVVLALLPRESASRAPTGSNPVTVALVQGNIAQELKWDPARQLETLVTYQRLSLTAALERRPALIVWPETAVPFSLEDPRRREPVLAVARAASRNRCRFRSRSTCSSTRTASTADRGESSFQYNCKKYACPGDLVGNLTRVAERYPRFVYLAPNYTMDARIALTREGEILVLDQYDPEKIQRFINR